MPPLPTLQSRPLLPTLVPVASAAPAAAPVPPMLQRQINAGAQMAQAVVSLQAAQPESAAASSESLKAHANALKVQDFLCPLLALFT